MSPFLLLLLVLLASPARAQLEAGVAEADVTPEVGVPLAGYGGRISPRPDVDPRTPHALFRPSTGVRDPIEAQALVLKPTGEPPLVLLTVDAIGVEYALLADVAGAARAAGVPLSPERLIMLASHTHSGPGSLCRRPLWQLAATDRFHRPTHRAFVEKCGRLIKTAWERRVPARFGSVSAPVRGVTRNRRAGRSTRIASEDVDPVLRVLRVDDMSGKPLAAFVSFAIHGICLDDDNLEFSADVPGVIRRTARARLGYPVLFSNGAEGDVSPAGDMDAVGGRIGQAIAELAPTARARVRGIQVAHAWHRFGGVEIHPGLAEGDNKDDIVARILGPIVRPMRRLGVKVREPFVTTRFRFTAARLGEVVLVCVPGEPITELGGQLMAAARAQGIADPWVLGLANGHMGYITTPEEYDQGGYEAWVTLYGRDTGTDLLRIFRTLLRRLAPM